MVKGLTSLEYSISLKGITMGDSIKTPFGMRGEKIIHIEELNKDERGLKCNCTCVECGKELVARLGEKNRWNFAHRSERGCSGGVETALHLFAKSVIEKSQYINLPDLSICYDKTDVEEADFILRQSNFKEVNNEFYEQSWMKIKSVTKGGKFYYQKVKAECKLDPIIPDIILYKTDRSNIERFLLIEIGVTHFIDEPKRKIIKEKDFSTIEVDLSKYKDEFANMSKDMLENLIINDVLNKTWIHNSKACEIISSAIDENKVYVDHMKLEGAQRKIRENEIKQNKELRHQNYKSKLINMFEMEEKLLEKYKNDKEKSQLTKLINKDYLDESGEAKWFIDFAVKGSIAFKCDKNIWRAVIFEEFIKDKCGQVISIQQVVNWIKNRSKLPLEESLKYIKRKPMGIYDLADAVYNYFHELENCKVVNCIGIRKSFWAEFEIIIDCKNLFKYESFNEYMSNYVSYNIQTNINADYLVSIGLGPTLVNYDAINGNKEKAYKCIYCGDITSNWSVYNGDGTCKCKSCFSKY